jgi:hypothetical protein
MGLFKDFQSIVMWMFWAFKLSFDVDILVFRPIFPKIWQNFIQLYGHTGCDLRIFEISYNVCPWQAFPA